MAKKNIKNEENVEVKDQEVLAGGETAENPATDTPETTDTTNTDEVTEQPQNDENHIEDKEPSIKDLTPEEKADLIKRFNEDPENTGYIHLTDAEPDEEKKKEYQDQLDKLMSSYQEQKVVIAPANDTLNMTKYVLEFIKNHMQWEGSWWKTVITLVKKLTEYDKVATENAAPLEVDFVTCFVLNKIFNEDTIRSNYQGALFMEKNLERLTYYGNRLALASTYVNQYSKNINVLQKAIMCMESGLCPEVTLPPLDPIDIATADEKSVDMVKKFKEDGIL